MPPKERWPVIAGTWNYQSFLVVPTDAEKNAKPGETVTAKKWAAGVLEIDQNVGPDIEICKLIFAENVELNVSLRLKAQEAGEPYVLTGKGIGQAGPTAGAEYQLTGWAMVSDSNDTEVVSAHGAVQLVKGSAVEKMPPETVGLFRLTRQSDDAGN